MSQKEEKVEELKNMFKKIEGKTWERVAFRGNECLPLWRGVAGFARDAFSLEGDYVQSGGFCGGAIISDEHVVVVNHSLSHLPKDIYDGRHLVCHLADIDRARKAFEDKFNETFELYPGGWRWPFLYANTVGYEGRILLQLPLVLRDTNDDFPDRPLEEIPFHMVRIPIEVRIYKSKEYLDVWSEAPEGSKEEILEKCGYAHNIIMDSFPLSNRREGKDSYMELIGKGVVGEYDPVIEIDSDCPKIHSIIEKCYRGVSCVGKKAIDFRMKELGLSGVDISNLEEIEKELLDRFVKQQGFIS